VEAVNESVYLYYSQELFSALILDGIGGWPFFEIHHVATSGSIIPSCESLASISSSYGFVHWLQAVQELVFHPWAHFPVFELSSRLRL
jgi:hypothetical protein